MKYLGKHYQTYVHHVTSKLMKKNPQCTHIDLHAPWEAYIFTACQLVKAIYSFN